LLAKSEITDLYLSGRTLATRANGNVLLHPLAEDWAASVRACLAEMPKRRWRIWLGGRRCELHLCEPISGVRSIEEAEAALGASLGLDARTVSVRLARWSAASHAWLAVATEDGLVDGLMAAVADSGGSVCCVRPWWTAVTGSRLTNAAMCDEETITYWRVDEHGTFSAAATLQTMEEQQSATLRRLHIGGALATWRIAMEAPAKRTPGFLVSALNKI